MRWCCLVAVAALLVPGCDGDECDLGPPHCRGRERVSCDEGDCHDPGCFPRPSNVEVVELCEHACVETGGKAFCALVTERDPGCANDVAGYCEGTHAVYCLAGFATGRLDCSETERECFMSDGSDPVCSFMEHEGCRELGRAGVSLCDGRQLVSCYGGLASSVRECENGCVSFEIGEAVCAEDTDAGAPDAGS